MRRGDWVSVVFGIAAVAASVLAIGGALRETQAVVALLVAGGVAPIIWSRRIQAKPSTLLLVLALPLAYSLIQLAPLPSRVIASFDSVGQQLRDEGATMMGVDPWRALTLDAPGTLRAVTFFTTLLGVAIISLRFATSERGRYRMLAVVSIVCGVTAAVVGVHELLGLTDLYGLYEPEQATPPVLGPLLNANHLGCLMAMGAVLSLGLFMHRGQTGRVRAVWVAITAGCAAVALATLSRGAALALMGGLIATVGTIGMQRFGSAEARRRRRGRFATSSLPIGILAVCGLVLVIYSSAGGVASQLSNTSLQEISQPKSKFMAWKSSVQLVEDSPWVGVGRGGFEPAFTRVHPAAAFVSVSHDENEYVQAVVDWGIPGALLLGLAGGALVLAALRRWNDGSLTAGAIGALVVVGAQSAVDFGVELLGVAVPITVVVATLVYVPLRESTPLRVWIARLGRIGLVVALIGSAALLMSSFTTSVGEDHDALADDDKLTVDDIRPALERHPLDYLGYGLAAQVMARHGDINAVRTLNHALVLHPTHPGLHRMAARILHTTNHDTQSAIEYADALRGTISPHMILQEILESFQDANDAAAAIPSDFSAIDSIVRQLDQLQRPDVSIVWLTHVLELRPKDVHACELLYAISVNTGDLSGAETIGRRCVELAPSHQTRFGLARVLFQREAYPDAIQQLQDVGKWPGRVADIVAGWFMLCDSYEQLARFDDAELCLHKLDARGLVIPEKHEDIQRRLDQLDKDRKHLALFGTTPPKPWIVWLR